MNPILTTSDFEKVMTDLAADLIYTFPEYTPLINKWSYMSTDCMQSFCHKKISPHRDAIMTKQSSLFLTADTEFLPNIHFKNLWQCDVSDETREALWKYLQLLYIHSFSSQTDEAVNKVMNVLQEPQMKEALSQLMENSIKESAKQTDKTKQATKPEKEKNEEATDYFSTMLNGNLGKLAREITEENADSLESLGLNDFSFSETDNETDIFAKLMSDPSKLFGMVKNVGEKMEAKLNSGELNRTDMMNEAQQLMTHGFPGMEQFQSMFNQFAKPKKSSAEVAMERKLELEAVKQRVRAKNGHVSVVPVAPTQNPPPAYSDQELIAMCAPTLASQANVSKKNKKK
jgi:hypothetical protein